MSQTAKIAFVKSIPTTDWDNPEFCKNVTLHNIYRRSPEGKQYNSETGHALAYEICVDYKTHELTFVYGKETSGRPLTQEQRDAAVGELTRIIAGLGSDITIHRDEQSDVADKDKWASDVADMWDFVTLKADSAESLLALVDHVDMREMIPSDFIIEVSKPRSERDVGKAMG